MNRHELYHLVRINRQDVFAALDLEDALDLAMIDDTCTCIETGVIWAEDAGAARLAQEVIWERSEINNLAWSD